MLWPYSLGSLFLCVFLIYFSELPLRQRHPTTFNNLWCSKLVIVTNLSRTTLHPGLRMISSPTLTPAVSPSPTSGSIHGISLQPLSDSQSVSTISSHIPQWPSWRTYTIAHQNSHQFIDINISGSGGSGWGLRIERVDVSVLSKTCYNLCTSLYSNGYFLINMYNSSPSSVYPGVERIFIGFVASIISVLFHLSNDCGGCLPPC